MKQTLNQETTGESRKYFICIIKIIKNKFGSNKNKLYICNMRNKKRDLSWDESLSEDGNKHKKRQGRHNNRGSRKSAKKEISEGVEDWDERHEDLMEDFDTREDKYNY